jgi:1-acyl-sn-glycerol-3-phosphate acyltransferase
MGSFESTLSVSTDIEDQEPPPSLNLAYPQELTVSGSVLPLQQKPASHASLSRFSPWLISLVYPLGRWAVIPTYFKYVKISGQTNLPRSGPLILAPTHRSRWDAILVAFAAGHYITGRHLHYMVTADEVVGLQGWLIKRLGGFPVDTRRPAIATLRHGVELLQQREPLVIFPEGNIFRETTVQPLKPGLARIALQAQASQPDLGVQIVPIHIRYSDPAVPKGCQVEIGVGAPLRAADYCQDAFKKNAQRLTGDLFEALNQLGNP